ncbi:hypothetical protein [Aquimarina aquimarini]|uniref:hypothetical protein n=1 Tax=Aquimarina aquimarini TaxID=1191734 RepID=UPI003CC61BFF
MKLLLYSVIILIGASCSSDKDNYIPIENINLEFTVPSNFPKPTYKMALNPPTEKGFELGKKTIL